MHEGRALMMIGLVAAVLVASLVASAMWILYPVDQAGKRLMRRTQFTLVDFLCLVFLIQLPMAMCHWFADPGARGTIGFFSCIVSSLMWGLSVQIMSRAGIDDIWQRGAFLALVLPVAYFGPFAFTAAWVAFLIGFSDPQEVRYWPALPVAAMAGLIIAFYFSGHHARRMVRARLARASEP